MKLKDATKSAKTSRSSNLDRTKLVKNLARNYKYAHHLDQAIQEHPDAAWTFKHEPKLSDLAWHPSSDATPSLHSLYHTAQARIKQNKGGPLGKPAKVELLKTWMVGNFWHRWLQHITVEYLGFADLEAVERAGTNWWGEAIPPKDYPAYFDENGTPYYRKEDLYYLRYPEQVEKGGTLSLEEIASWPTTKLGNGFIRPKPFHWVKGSGDIAPAELPGYGTYLIDFKTMNKVDYNRNDPPEWCAAKWECQLNIYFDLFSLENAILVGILKDNPHDFKEFEYRRNQPLIDTIYEKWELVSDCLDHDVEPPEKEVIKLPLQGPVER